MQLFGFQNKINLSFNFFWFIVSCFLFTSVETIPFVLKSFVFNTKMYVSVKNMHMNYYVTVAYLLNYF